MVMAISGKCCSGKNYISSLFESSGFTIIDVDKISADIFNQVTEEVVSIFGKDVIVNGEVDRKRVGDILFSDIQKREALEGIIHPLVYNSIFNIIDSDSQKDYIVNIPLLKQGELLERLDGIVWVNSPLLLRIFRAYRRDSYRFITLFRRIITQKKLSVKYLKTTVDIYYIDNSWFSIGLKSKLNLILNRLQRG